MAIQGLDIFKDVRYVIDKDGKRAAIQLDINDWSSLLDYLEDLEDRALIRDKLSRLLQNPQKSGAMSWDEVSSAWESNH